MLEQWTRVCFTKAREASTSSKWTITNSTGPTYSPFVALSMETRSRKCSYIPEDTTRILTRILRLACCRGLYWDRPVRILSGAFRPSSVQVLNCKMFGCDTLSSTLPMGVVKAASHASTPRVSIRLRKKLAYRWTPEENPVVAALKKTRFDFRPRIPHMAAKREFREANNRTKVKC